jgi:hypothetical protein
MWIVLFIVWTMMPAGVFFVAVGHLGWGILLLAGGVVIAGAALEGRILRTLEAREIPRKRGHVQLLIWPTLTVLNVLTVFLISDAFGPGMRVLLAIYSAGMVALMGMAVRHVLRSMDTHI